MIVSELTVMKFAGLSSFAASYKYLVDHPTLINDAYGWHFQYLTIIGLALATITFSAGSLADITSSQRLFRIKNAFSVVATPLEVLITTLYGSLVSVDKELVIPKEFQLGLLPDISFHAVPAIALYIKFPDFEIDRIIKSLAENARQQASVGFFDGTPSQSRARMLLNVGIVPLAAASAVEFERQFVRPQRTIDTVATFPYFVMCVSGSSEEYVIHLRRRYSLWFRRISDIDAGVRNEAIAKTQLKVPEIQSVILQYYLS
ncbi:MAG: hypothetical protein Q9166_003354 [cf. Caloplaca sp. 2 TL-2023]